MERKIVNFMLFYAGDPDVKFPTRVFASYGIQASGTKATKRNLVFEIPDPDPSVSMGDVWDQTMAAIKNIEGVN